MKRASVPVAVGLLLAACSGNSVTASTAASVGACGPAVSPTPVVPSDAAAFPSPGGLVIVGVERTGTTSIVIGYIDRSLVRTYGGYQSALGLAGYTVDRKSISAGNFADVFFTGNSTTGEVKLLTECANRTDVTITIRAA